MSTPPPQRVLIAGAGLGGLLLAILLERAGIEYHVYEKHDEFRALGSVTSLSANIMPVFDQLGLLKELQQISLVMSEINVYNHKMTRVGHINVHIQKEKSGYDVLMMWRKDLHQLLVNHVPKEKISLSQKIVSIEQTKSDVTIVCAGGQRHRGALLVGADGAYSAVRKSMYDTLAKANKLDPDDLIPMKATHIAILGATESVEHSQYPWAHEEKSSMECYLGESSKHTWRLFNIKGAKICWSISFQIDPTAFDDKEMDQLAEWDRQSFNPDSEKWRDFATKIGCTMADLINLTPTDSIAKVMFEEKLFETWHHGRVVLLGDACHKMLPSAGRGALNAMLDSVVVANAIYEMTSFSNLDQIQKGFRGYYLERYPHAASEISSSKQMARVTSGDTWLDKLTRRYVLNLMPKWIHRKNAEDAVRFRPQASFLPQVGSKGSEPALPQKISKKYKGLRMVTKSSDDSQNEKIVKLAPVVPEVAVV
ncbi:hypothetical protein EMPS_07419 [Entomortierella parvispora]|uniref:FAD-binding domain-containing protein n=1 Tax=Entomortierella parvispora TaxID=205924 RepID=A0A9P3HEE3_9FUNG|nr:hypothetical protein EMPS_07419 [Entomortierella parvispora]